MSKVFNDPIWGHIELSPLSIKVIDTPIFQRLRDLSQLGNVSAVFPAASNKRFEHSLGVAHLARSFIKKLRENQPSLGITDVDVLCVELAGLVHDLGHGPYSHMFDGIVLPQLGAPNYFCHEHASVQLFDLLIREYKLEGAFARYGLGEREIQLVKELILGDEEESVGIENFKWIGPSPKKAFMFDIVANKRNGVDVDKMDYFFRDAHLLNIPVSFDAMRLMRFARVYMVKREDSSASDVSPGEAATEICFHKKESWNVFEFFHSRYSLYKRAYLHKVSTGIDMMIAESLCLANDYITVPGKDGKATKMSECWCDMHAYWRFTEYITRQIYHSCDPNLAASRAYIERILRRDIFVCVSEYILDDTEASRQIKSGTVLAGLRAVRDAFDPSDEQYEAVQRVRHEDIFAAVIKMGWGSNGNPVDRVAFYLPEKSSSSSSSSTQDSARSQSSGGGGVSGSQASEAELETVDVGVVERDHLSRLLPTRYEERVVRMYASRKELVEGCSAIFRRWVESAVGKAPPSPLSPMSKRRRTGSHDDD